jgi:hypothetical protein
VTSRTRPPRVGVANATSTSEETSCTPVSTTSSSHCTSRSTSCSNPAGTRPATQAGRQRAHLPGRRPGPAGLPLRTPLTARGRSPPGPPVPLPVRPGRLQPPPAPCRRATGRHPGPPAVPPAKPSDAASWPTGPATAMTAAICAGTGASSSTCWPARTACRWPGAWPTRPTGNARSPRACWTGPPASASCA